MRPVGFSTGALALGDLDRSLAMLRGRHVAAVELSALRFAELPPLVAALDGLDLSSFSYVSVHAPGTLAAGEEARAVELLAAVAERGWPIVLHPDAVHRFERWAGFGRLLLIENMDGRKPAGRTAAELARVFERLPDAALCLDVGHARQVDASMAEARRILEAFGGRLRQLHVSDVGPGGEHSRLTPEAVVAFRGVAGLVPEGVAAILEGPVGEEEIEGEMAAARGALEPGGRPASA